jgi:hypothetical protein
MSENARGMAGKRIHNLVRTQMTLFFTARAFHCYLVVSPPRPFIRARRDAIDTPRSLRSPRSAPTPGKRASGDLDKANL